MDNTFEFIIVGLIGIIGYFLRDIHSNFKEYKRDSEIEQLRQIEELGKLKGKIEMVQQQSANDLKRIEEVTQLKLDQIGKDVSDLSKYLHDYLKRNSSQN
jgi:hypothetical protein